MYPLLFSIGSFHVYVLSVLILVSWLVYSFLFWRSLRSNGVDEDKIFDITFWSTLLAAITSRAVFIGLHPELFADAWLKTVAIWVQPGFSLYGAIVGCCCAYIYFSRSLKVRLGHMLDAIAVSFPAAILLALIGVLFDGSVPGTHASLPWAVRIVGVTGTRHPVQAYEILALILIIILIAFISRKSKKDKRPYGVVGMWFFILYSLLMFLLEFFKDTHVYWISLRANQWVLIALFAESLGAFYVRGGGREATRPILVKVRSRITKVLGGIYAKFSKRHTE